MAEKEEYICCNDLDCKDPHHMAIHHHHCKFDHSSVANRIKNVYNSGKFTDITIIFARNEDRVQAHRLVLAMSSPEFAKMLFGTTPVGPVLHLPDDSPEGFRWLLDYMYTDASQFRDTNIALEVSHLASKYKMDALKCLCSDYLKRTMNDINYLKVYNAAVQLNNSDLITQCSKLMNTSGLEVYSSQLVTQLSRHALKYLLNQPCNVVDEVTIFRSVVTWGKYKLGERQRAVTPSDLRHEVEEFLPYVRFLTMTADQIVESVMPTELFTPDEIMNLLKAIKKQKDVILPEFCSHNRERRNLQCYQS